MTAFNRFLPQRQGVSLQLIAPEPHTRTPEQSHLTLAIDLELPMYGHFHLDLPLTVGLAGALIAALQEATAFALGDPSIPARRDLPPIDPLKGAPLPADWLDQAPAYDRGAEEARTDALDRAGRYDQWTPSQGRW